MYIYKTTNLITNKIYVGQTIFDNKNYFGSGVYLNNSIKKHGKKNFKKEILEYCKKDKLNEREIFWISELDATNPKVGYNLNKGGGGDGYTNIKKFSKKIKYLQKKVINKFLEKRLKIGKRKGST